MSDELERLMEQVEAKHDPDATKSVQEIFSEIVALAEEAEADFVADHCTKMFGAAIFERSNAKKVTLYHVLQAAIEAVALFESDDSPAEMLARRVVRAEHYLFDEPNDVRFKEVIIRAFKDSQFGSFTRLAEEIRKAEAAENLHRAAFRMIGPRKVVLDREARRLMNARVPPSRRDLDNPISRHEVTAALASRRKKP